VATGWIHETIYGFEVDYKPDDDCSCDRIALVQVIGHSFLGRNLIAPNERAPEVDVGGNIDSPVYLDAAPLSGRGTGNAWSYFDAPGQNNKTLDVTFYIEVCAVCVKCECLEEYRGERNVIWANTEILGCTRFDWDNKNTEFTVRQPASQISVDEDGTAHVEAYKTPSQLYSSGEWRWHHRGGNRGWADDWCKKNYKP
jgi:hypothetical protein